MKRLLLCILLMLQFFLVAAQGCLSSGITFTSQEQIDSFAINYPQCTEILGDLYINSDDITSLQGLSQLTAIRWRLDISNSDGLTDLQGLNNITTIGGALDIKFSNGLTSLEGLNSLTSIGHFFRIDYSGILNLNGLENLETVGLYVSLQNSDFTTLEGLNSLTTIGGDLTIHKLDQLGVVDGFEALTTIGGGLNITFSNGLVGTSGLNQLISINDGIVIHNNFDFRLLGGFESLETVGGNIRPQHVDGVLSIEGLFNLTSVEGDFYLNNTDMSGSTASLSNLSSISGDLLIQSNFELTTLNFLENLNHVGGDLSIRLNPQLNDCSVAGICNYLSEEGMADITGNGFGCSSESEILSDCLGFGFSGHTFYDFNQNGEWDDFEAGIPVQQIQVTPTGNTLFTNQSGRYLNLCEEGQSYTFSLIPDSDWVLTTDSASYSVTFEPNNPTNQQNNFGLFPSYETHDLGIYMTSAQPRCNTDVNFYLDVCNEGTFLETEGLVVVEYDERLTYNNAVPTPLSVDEINHELTWSYDILYPFQCEDYVINFGIPGVDFIGEYVDLTTNTFLDSMGTPVLANQNQFSTEILCSYDPNDKLVEPKGVQDANYTLKEETFHYTVRFQNTGNISAIDVTIQDTLDTDLDWNTFRVLQSSHSLQTTLKSDGAVTFYFEEIYLPDSISDPIGSQGFLHYSIDPIVGLADHTVVENTAYIIFDQNPPIITNTTMNTLVDEIPIIDNVTTLQQTAFHCYPNPATGRFLVVVDESLNIGQYQCHVLDARGRPLYLYDSLPQNEVDLSDNPTGIYVVLLREKTTGQVVAFERILLMK